MMEDYGVPIQSKTSRAKLKWNKLKGSFVTDSNGNSGESNDSLALPPESTIIAFDLHDVLARPNKKKMAKVILNHPEKKLLVKSLQASGFAKKLVLARCVGKDDTVPEKKMKDLTQSCEKPKDQQRYEILNPLVSELCNCQDPDIDTFKLIGRLKAAGYSIYLLSNIGSDYFNQLREFWPPDLFDDFDGFYTTNPDHGYVKKPNPEIFKFFLQMFNPEKEKHVVFIDDSEDNIRSACEVGLLGTLYKSAEHLEKKLINMGITIFMDD